jgi:hypothetical protein
MSLHGLCAGTSYRIALSVQDGPGNVSEYISARPGVRRDGDAVEGTTDQTEVMYATKVTVREVPASWHGRYIRVRTVTGGSEGRTDWRWTWSNPPPLLHPPASDWSYDTACAAVDDLFDQRPDHIVEYGTGARSGVISVPGQPSTPIGGLEHRASQSLAKWPEDVDLDVGVQAWLSSTSCGDLVSQDQVDHASPSDFVWTNAFRGHGRITPADRAPGTWVDGDAQALDVRSPSTPGLVLQVRVVATRADHADR